MTDFNHLPEFAFFGADVLKSGDPSDCCLVQIRKSWRVLRHFIAFCGLTDVDVMVSRHPALIKMVVFARLGDLNQAKPKPLFGELPNRQLSLLAASLLAASLLAIVLGRGLAFPGVRL